MYQQCFSNFYFWFVYFEHWCISISISMPPHICLPFAIWIQRIRWIFSVEMLLMKRLVIIMIWPFDGIRAVQSLYIYIYILFDLSFCALCICAERLCAESHIRFGMKNDQWCVVEILDWAANFCLRTMPNETLMLFKYTKYIICIYFDSENECIDGINPKMMEHNILVKQHHIRTQNKIITYYIFFGLFESKMSKTNKHKNTKHQNVHHTCVYMYIQCCFTSDDYK